MKLAQNSKSTELQLKKKKNRKQLASLKGFKDEKPNTSFPPKKIHQ